MTSGKVKPVATQKSLESVLEDDAYKCGYCSWKPTWLQNCNNPRALLACVCWFTFTQGAL